jgi:hypothetical protein
VRTRARSERPRFPALPAVPVRAGVPADAAAADCLDELGPFDDLAAAEKAVDEFHWSVSHDRRPRVTVVAGPVG